MLESLFYWTGATVLLLLLAGCIPLAAHWAWNKYVNAVYGWANITIIKSACDEWKRNNWSEYQRRLRIADRWTLKQTFQNLRRYRGIEDDGA